MRLKLLTLAMVFVCTIALGQNVPFQASADTAKPVPATKWWIRALGYTFPDGSKMTSASGLADSSKYVEGLDSLKGAGYATRTMLQTDSLSRKAIQAADSTYKAAQIALKKANSDSVLATGYYTNEKARVDTTERNSLIAKKKANSDTTAATGYYTNEKARVDTVNRNVLIAKRIAYGDTLAFPTIVPARNGQSGWWTRPAGWSYLTPATATDTLRVPVIWGGTTPALFMDASRNLTAGTGTFTGSVASSSFFSGTDGRFTDSVSAATIYSSGKITAAQDVISLANGFSSRGTSGQFEIYDRTNSARNFIWYVTGGKMYVYSGLNRLEFDSVGNQANSGYISATDFRASDSVSAVSGAFSGGLTGATLSLNSASVTTSILGVKGTNAKLNLLELYRSSSATAGVIVDSNFNVGIGTTAPTSKLTIAPSFLASYLKGLEVDREVGSTGTRAYLNAYSGEVNLIAYEASDYGVLNLMQYKNSTTDMRTVLRIIANGNVGIGITAPTGKLDVQAGLQLYAQRWLRTATGGTPVEVASIDTNGVAVFTGNKISGVIVGDSIQVTATGITTATGDAIVCYRNATSLLADTAASYRINTAGKITLTGKHGWTVKGFITSK